MPDQPFPDADLDAADTSEPLSVRRAGLEIAGYAHALFSLMCDYHCTPHTQWQELLDSVQALGFRVIDVSVVWECHSTGENEYDFGETDPQLDLLRFLDMAQARGLYVCLRPGPRQDIAPTLAHRGIARHVALDERSHARSSRPGALDAPSTIASPEPSLVSDFYAAQAEAWLEEVGRRIRSHCYPRGPVVAVHLESVETVRAYESESEDENVGTDAAFRAFLRSRYERPSLLRLAYGDQALDFGKVRPPTSPEGSTGLAPKRDWLAFRRHLVTSALDRFVRALASTSPPLPTSIPEFEARSRLQLRFADTAMTGQPSARRWSVQGKTPLLDNLGGRLPLVDIDVGSVGKAQGERVLYRAMLSLAAGARGLVLTPGWERPGVVGCLITVQGEPTPLMKAFAPLLAALDRTQFHALRLEPCVHIVLSDYLLDLGNVEVRQRQRPERWLRHRSALDADDGTETDPELAQLRVLRQCLAALEHSLVRAGVPFRYASEWELDQVVGTSPWTIVPTTQRTPEALVETIRFVRRRGDAFSIGPFAPEGLDQSAQHKNWPDTLEATEQGLTLQVEDLVRRGLLPRREISTNQARVLVHSRVDDGEPRLAVAFVLNPTSEPINAEVACPGYGALDALTQERIRSFAERLQVSVPPESVRMLELFPDERPHGAR